MATTNETYITYLKNMRNTSMKEFIRNITNIPNPIPIVHKPTPEYKNYEKQINHVSFIVFKTIRLWCSNLNNVKIPQNILNKINAKIKISLTPAEQEVIDEIENEKTNEIDLFNSIQNLDVKTRYISQLLNLYKAVIIDKKPPPNEQYLYGDITKDYIKNNVDLFAGYFVELNKTNMNKTPRLSNGTPEFSNACLFHEMTKYYNNADANRPFATKFMSDDGNLLVEMFKPNAIDAKTWKWKTTFVQCNISERMATDAKNTASSVKNVFGSFITGVKGVKGINKDVAKGGKTCQRHRKQHSKRHTRKTNIKHFHKI